MLIEAGFGFRIGSLALLADAAHNLTDVAGLLLAWGAVALSRQPPSNLHTYGLGRASILAALVNGVALMIAVGALAWEALSRFAVPADTAVQCTTVSAFTVTRILMCWNQFLRVLTVQRLESWRLVEADIGCYEHKA